MNTPEYIIEKSKEGNDTIIVLRDGQRLPLHSAYNPTKESELFAGEFNPDKHDILVVLGTGLGYHLVPLKGMLNRYRRIVCIDILASIEPAIRKNPLTGFLADSPAVTIISGRGPGETADEAVKLMDFGDARGIAVIEHPASCRIFRDFYGAVKDILKKHIDRTAGSVATKKRFGMIFVRNILSNIRTLPSARAVKDLAGAFAPYPALVVSSAPSLELYLPHIRDHQQKAIIIAVDSAVPVLMSAGVRPDLVVTIDPQPYIWEHLAQAPGDVLYLYSIASHRLPEHLGHRFCSLNSHPIAQLADQMSGGRVGSVDSGTGSVAGDALNAAIAAGANAVGLIGFDFSFSDYKIYSRGTAYQNRYSRLFQDRFRTVESRNMSYIRESSRGYRESGKFTRRSLVGYRDSLAMMIREKKLSGIVSINRIGLPVPGIPIMDFGEFIETRCRDTVPKQDLARKLLASSPRLGDTIGPEAIAKFMMQDDIMNMIIEESIGAEGHGERKKAMRLAAALLLK